MSDESKKERKPRTPGTEYLRYEDLVAMGIMGTRMTLGRYIRECGFPEGFKIGGRVRIFPRGDVIAWVESNGGTDVDRADA